MVALTPNRLHTIMTSMESKDVIQGRFQLEVLNPLDYMVQDLERNIISGGARDAKTELLFGNLSSSLNLYIYSRCVSTYAIIL